MPTYRDFGITLKMSRRNFSRVVFLCVSNISIKVYSLASSICEKQNTFAIQYPSMRTYVTFLRVLQNFNFDVSESGQFCI